MLDFLRLKSSCSQDKQLYCAFVELSESPQNPLIYQSIVYDLKLIQNYRDARAALKNLKIEQALEIIEQHNWERLVTKHEGE